MLIVNVWFYLHYYICVADALQCYDCAGSGCGDPFNASGNDVKIFGNLCYSNGLSLPMTYTVVKCYKYVFTIFQGVVSKFESFGETMRTNVFVFYWPCFPNSCPK